jgi:uncharacterized repeat protein (TIGR01451 family)
MSNMRKQSLLLAVLGVVAVSGILAGCQSYHVPFPVMPGGHIVREHGKPEKDWYYENWDKDAVSLEVVPLEDTNPVKTQHVLIATVSDPNGKPLHSRRVEWLIAEGSVGSIIEVDESGFYDTRGYKVNNKYAVSHTNQKSHVLDRGTADPSDDIHISEGQTWCVITSPIEGDTHMVVYAPAIYNWEKHKVFAVKHWRDVEWEWPPDATNTVGTPHEMAVRVMKASDGTPLAGWVVNFKLLDGPEASFAPGGGATTFVNTDANGIAMVTLNQAAPVEGTNTIEMQIIRPANEQCCIPAQLIATGQATKTWVGPRIGIEKTAPATAGVGDEFMYDIMVTNPGRAPATSVRVTDTLPEGIEYVSSVPSAEASGQSLAWGLGTLEPGESKSISVRVTATRTGTFENCAEVAADHDLSDRDCATTVVTAPALAIEKTGPAEVLLCDIITYTVVIRNTGDGPATNVTVVDELPDGLMSENGRSRVVINAGTIEPGQAKKATYNAKASRTGTFGNTAVATADGDLRAEDSHELIVRQPVLVVSKSGPEQRFINRNVEYEITVTNSGDGEARDTVLVDTIPDGMTFVSASDGGQVSGNTVTWTLGTLAPEESRDVSLTLKAAAMGSMRNVASARAYCAEGSDDAVTEISGIAAILLEVVDVEDPIEIGQNETYTITVTNQGSAVGTNIRVVCTIPDEQEYVSSDGPTQATVEGQKVTFEPLPQLAPKAEAVFQVVTKGRQTGDLRFAVELISDQMTSPVNETESTHVYE